ncbi:MAG: hypothetical protein QG675_665 [Patescibacteria group bacterium]|nr:hypothetical protein [Patescibacteria group bacterium]
MSKSKKNRHTKDNTNDSDVDLHIKHKKRGRKLNIVLVTLSVLLLASISALTYLFITIENAKIDAKNALQQQVEVGNANVVSYVTTYERFVQIFQSNRLEFLAIIIISVVGIVLLVMSLYKDRKKRKYHKQHFKKVHHNHSKPDKIHTIDKYRAPWENIWLLVGGILVVAVVGILVLRISRASTEITQNTTNIEASALEEQGFRQINSSTGFSLIYNFNLLDAEATIAGQSEPVATKEELAKASDYTAVVIEPSAADTDSLTGSNTSATSDLRFNTSTDKQFFVSAKNQFGNLSQTELAIRYFAPKQDANNFVEKIGQSEVDVSGVKYQEVVYKVINTEYVTTTETFTQYITVQNNQPFAVSLRQSSRSVPSQVQLLKNVISTIKYGHTEQSSHTSFSSRHNTAMAATEPTSTEADSSVLSQTTTNVPKTLINDTALQVVAKNQPTVVRVGTNTCMNIDLLLPNGQVGYSAKNACNAVIGSGSIISSDGYISTNGHVVSDIPEQILQTFLSLDTDSANLKSYLQYLLDSGVLTKPQLETVLRQVAAGNKQAFEKFLTTTTKISPDKYKTSSVNRSFVIQLSNDPIKAEVDKTTISIPTSDTKVSAKLIDKDFDEQTLRQTQIANIKELKTSDVAILKLDSGSNYPVSSLGALDESKDNTSSSSAASELLVTAMGFPGFVDGGLTTKKQTTIPSATQGKVLGFENNTDNKYRLIATNVPAAQGNSGGPAFAEDGSIIGLVTYVDQSANAKAGTESFAASSILRDVSDVKALLSKNNITLNTSSSVDSTWDQGIEKFSNAHYKSANQLFAKAKAEYPANYLATQLSSVADAKIAAGLDVPEISPIVTIGAVVFVLALLIGLIIVIIKTIKHRNKTKTMMPPVQPGVDSNPVTTDINPVPTSPGFNDSSVATSSGDVANVGLTQAPVQNPSNIAPNVYQPTVPAPTTTNDPAVEPGNNTVASSSSVPVPESMPERPAQVSPVHSDNQAPTALPAQSSVTNVVPPGPLKQAPSAAPAANPVDDSTGGQPPVA